MFSHSRFALPHGGEAHPGPAWEDTHSELVFWKHPSLVFYPESLGFLQMCSWVFFLTF